MQSAQLYQNNGGSGLLGKAQLRGRGFAQNAETQPLASFEFQSLSTTPHAVALLDMVVLGGGGGDKAFTKTLQVHVYKMEKVGKGLSSSKNRLCKGTTWPRCLGNSK